MVGGCVDLGCCVCVFCCSFAENAYIGSDSHMTYCAILSRLNTAEKMRHECQWEWEYQSNHAQFYRCMCVPRCFFFKQKMCNHLSVCKCLSCTHASAMHPNRSLRSFSNSRAISRYLLLKYSFVSTGNSCCVFRTVLLISTYRAWMVERGRVSENENASRDSWQEIHFRGRHPVDAGGFFQWLLNRFPCGFVRACFVLLL